jgi:hypothetical protein
MAGPNNLRDHEPGGCVTDHIDANDEDRSTTSAQDEMTVRLLRLAGMRAEVPAERAARVRAAVLSECRTVARARAVRRRVMAAAGVLSAAAAVMIAVRLWFPSAVRPSLGARLAIVETAQGTGLQVRDTTGALSASRMQTGAAIREGDRIETDGASRVSVRLTGGASLRFDHATAARLVSARRIELSAGAVYVDSGSASPGLEVRTRLASVRDIGTQFEVRVGERSLRVRVRSGLVEVQRGRDVSSARPGVELTVDSDRVTSRDILAHGPDWEWAARLAPAFAIEGRSLRTFLERWCHEEGWALAYADPALARDASGIILHGSTDGLPPVEALTVVLTTTGLTHRFEDGQLVVARSARP